MNSLHRPNPRHNLALCWLAAMWLCVVGAARAETNVSYGDYLIDVWTRENGLPNSSVTAIAQTADGYLWIGTYNGLARFDGQSFLKFDPENTPALRNARVRRLYATDDGSLWICVHDGSISLYRGGEFSLEWRGDGAADTAPTLVSVRSNQPLFQLRNGELIQRVAETGTNRWQLLRPPGADAGELVAQDGAGDVWCRARDQRLWRWRGSGFEAMTNNGLAGAEINVLTVDAGGRLWAASERQIAMWSGERFTDMTPTNGEPLVDAQFMRVLPDGAVWTISGGRVKRSRGRAWDYELEKARDLFTGWRERTGLHHDKSGGVWLYDYGRGLFHVRADGAARQLMTEPGFPGERVDCFFEDREGNFWAGVDRGGLVRIRERRFKVLLPGEDAASRTAVTVSEDESGAIWVGTYGGGLYRWFGDDWRGFALPGGTRRGFVFSIVPDGSGQLWMSAGEEDLYFGDERRFAPFTPALHGVKVLLRARDGKLWVGNKSGLTVVSGSQVNMFTAEMGVPRGDNIRALAEDSAGMIWAGGGDGTLYRIEPLAATNRVTSFRATDAWAGQPIWSLLADADGGVWVGTFRGGLMHFHRGTFTRFTSRHGLPDDVICQILDDDSGRLWCGTQQGIFRVNKSELQESPKGTLRTVNSYGRYDGLPSVECSGNYQPSGWRTRDGRLLFATLGGVAVVRPDEVRENLLPPPVLIERAVVDGEERQAEPVKRMTRGGLADEATLIVPPGKRQVIFHFTGLSLVSPDRVRFRYQLEGLDNDWIEAGTRRSAQYSFLVPRDYRFRVMACNNDGVWTPEGVSWRVVVLPRIYETWWFRLVAVVGLLGVVVFTVRRISGRRLRRKLEIAERQRAIERDRTRIAKDIHDDLGAGLTHISLLSELARRDSPEQIHNHVGQISEMARELTRSMDEIVWAVDPHNDSLDSLVTYVTKFAQEYLGVAGIRCRLDLPAQVPGHALPAEVRHNLFLAIKESLNNVVKHAHATEVWLRLALESDAFAVSIEDNGRGIAAGERNGESHGRISSGHGLDNLRRRLEAVGGDCEIGGADGGGTRVRFTVRLSSNFSPELATGSGRKQD